jgi:hypothetical protein
MIVEYRTEPVAQGQQRIAAGEGQVGNMGGVIGRRRR